MTSRKPLDRRPSTKDDGELEPPLTWIIGTNELLVALIQHHGEAGRPDIPPALKPK